MSAIGSRIQLYASEHHCLPDKLSDLPLITAQDSNVDAIKDAWGRLILYEHHPDGTAVLISQGVNGQYPIQESYTISFPATAQVLGAGK
jgi:hypothetical protein